MLDGKYGKAALEKLTRGRAFGEVAAVLVGESGPPDLDGVRWTLVVTDGTETDVIEADLSRSEGGSRGMDIAVGVVEGVVEDRAVNSFPLESRLADLVEASPLNLRAEEISNRETLGSLGQQSGWAQ